MDAALGPESATERVTSELAPHRSAKHLKDAAEVALDEHTDGPRAQRSGSTRDDVPIPPFHSNAIVPAPAPTLPSATGPALAFSRAEWTASAPIGRERMALSPPSLVSPTTGLMDCTRSMPGCARSSATTASAARQTHNVHVRR